jgi:hypothetical protein
VGLVVPVAGRVEDKAAVGADAPVVQEARVVLADARAALLLAVVKAHLVVKAGLAANAPSDPNNCS